MIPIEFLEQLVMGGLGNLAAYLAAHVLLCLLPAFGIAGAMTSMIPKEAVTRFLGRNTPRWISYPAAALAGSVLAVCSCTIVPLFAGIHKKGAGLGPAITFLFFAPAANILALITTGSIIGPDLAFARLALSLVFGIGIGMIMALIFSREDSAHDAATSSLFSSQKTMRPAAAILLVVLVVLLLSGTLKIGLLTNSYAQISLPVAGADQLQEALYQLIPFDPARGEEGVSLQGAILIMLLALIGLSAWRGLEHIHESVNRWTWGSVGLVSLTLLVASVGLVPYAGGLDILITGKLIGVLIALAVAAYIAKWYLTADEMRSWGWETWRFVKQIFPLLLGGVILVGMLRTIIRPEWIETLAGQNTIMGNVAGVVFGVFMYFPTLVEVPIAQMFLGLGMHRGPLLAYLMADPELSLQSILVISTVIGRLKAWTYVGWVALFSTLAGLIYGAWVDGASLLVLVLILAGFLAVLALGLWVLNKHNLNLEKMARPA